MDHVRRCSFLLSTCHPSWHSAYLELEFEAIRFVVDRLVARQSNKSSPLNFINQILFHSKIIQVLQHVFALQLVINFDRQLLPDVQPLQSAILLLIQTVLFPILEDVEHLADFIDVECGVTHTHLSIAHHDVTGCLHI